MALKWKMLTEPEDILALMRRRESQYSLDATEPVRGVEANPMHGSYM